MLWSFGFLNLIMQKKLKGSSGVEPENYGVFLSFLRNGLKKMDVSQRKILGGGLGQTDRVANTTMESPHPEKNR